MPNIRIELVPSTFNVINEDIENTTVPQLILATAQLRRGNYMKVTSPENGCYVEIDFTDIPAEASAIVSNIVVSNCNEGQIEYVVKILDTYANLVMMGELSARLQRVKPKILVP